MLSKLRKLMNLHYGNCKWELEQIKQDKQKMTTEIASLNSAIRALTVELGEAKAAQDYQCMVLEKKVEETLMKERKIAGDLERKRLELEREHEICEEFKAKMLAQEAELEEQMALKEEALKKLEAFKKDTNGSTHRTNDKRAAPHAAADQRKV